MNSIVQKWEKVEKRKEKLELDKLDSIEIDGEKLELKEDKETE